MPPSASLSPALMIAAAILGLVFSFALFVAARYKRCPANKVLVISGSFTGDNAAKCISGGGAFVLPVVQEYDYLSLEPIQIDIPLKDALSFENIRVSVPSVFTVAIGTDDVVRQNAAIRLLKLDQPQIKRQAQDIIFGQLRQVIASMRIEEINKDRETFLHNILTSLEPELRKIGLVLLNVNITDINDESGYIEAIGRKAAAEAVQKARGDVADQEKLGEVRVAEAEREKQIQVANANKLREIGIREASREQAIRLAELDKEQKIGEQTAAYQREAQVKEAEQLKRVAIATAEAKAVAGEAQSQAHIVATQAQLQVKQAEAYEIGEIRKRTAEAAVLEAQNRAMAKAALADAERVEAERRAELEAPAKAEKARTIVEAEAEAERKRIHAVAEAAATYAKLEAEARGQYQILAKKGEGLREIVAAAGGAREAFQLLMLEHMDKLAETAATAISNIKFDKIVVWDGGDGASTSNFLQNFTRGLPPMMQVIQDIGGVQLPEFLGKLQPESDGPGNQDDVELITTAAAPPSPDDRERDVPAPADGGDRRQAERGASVAQ
ncbi:MAG TPA: SPFH domain-containing protein [Longimicrobium sp.]|nr:SPFH domain-containing protein [Longimicrobium sp.]